MSDYTILKGTTSVIIPIFIGDATTADGAGKTGLTNASITAAYSRDDQGNAAATAISVVSATRGTYTSGGFVEKDATAAPGLYEFGPPTGALASGSNRVVITFKDAGSNNLILKPIVIELVAYDPQNAASLGLSRIDQNVSAASTLTSAYDAAKTAAQAGDAMALTSGERTTLAAAVWNALTSGLTTVSSIGKLLVDNINATIGSRSSHSAADVWTSGTRTLTSFGTLVADIATAVWGASTRILTAFGFTVTTNDATSIATIKTKTDQLAFGVANVLNANVTHVNEIEVGGDGTTIDPWGPV